MAKRRRRTLAHATIERAGVRRGSQVMTFIMQWWMLHHENGEPPNAESYAEFWGISPATAYRHLAAFRETWPEFHDPSGVAAVLGLDLVEGTVPSPMGTSVEGIEA